jgi:structural maintenance of chromosome 4
MMKPKGNPANPDGLLEYLEDLIGSDKYIKPIEEAGQKVDSFNEVRQEKLNRVKIVEKEKESLEVCTALYYTSPTIAIDALHVIT